MPDESFAFEWKLFDAVSGPAAKIEISLKRAEGALRGASGSARHSVNGWKMLGLGIGGIAGVAAATTDAFFGLGRSVLSVAGSVGKFALNAVTSRENTLLALEAVTGGAKEARTELAQWSALADGTGFKTSQISEWGKQFRIAGHDAADTMVLLKTVAAAGTLNGFDATKMSGLVEAIDHMRALGHLDSRVLREFASANIPTDRVLANIARATHQPLAAVRRELQKDLITPYLAELGLSMTVRDIGGGSLDKLIARGAHTTTGLLSTIESRVEGLFKRLEGGELHKAFNGVLSNIVELLSPTSDVGKQLNSEVKDLANMMASWLKPLTGDEGRHGMADFFTQMKNGVDDVLPGVRTITEFLGFFAGEGLDALKGIGMMREIGHDIARIVGGKAPETKTGSAFLEAAYGDLRDPARALGPDAKRRVAALQLSSAGRTDEERAQIFMESLQLQRSAPAAKPTITFGDITTQVHVHGDASHKDADSLGKKVGDHVREQIHGIFRRAASQVGGGRK